MSKTSTLQLRITPELKEKYNSLEEWEKLKIKTQFFQEIEKVYDQKKDPS